MVNAEGMLRSGKGRLPKAQPRGSIGQPLAGGAQEESGAAAGICCGGQDVSVPAASQVAAREGVL